MSAQAGLQIRSKSFMEKLRVLCLHGYQGSAHVLRRQMAALADGLDDVAAFVYLDAPSLAAGDFGWWRAVAVQSATTPTNVGVGLGAKRYEGWQKTRDAIVSAFARQGPFDGLFGFSQGAALAALLVGLRSRDDLVASGLADPAGRTSGSDKSLSFDFAVMVGGFVAADADLAGLYGEKANYDLPSAHIIGRSDAVVPREASLGLASKFNNPLILEHEGGHVISNAPHIRQGFRIFLDEMRQRKSAHRLARSRA
jgi:pimeloyl-ACP methyl ester carboxylesterase